MSNGYGLYDELEVNFRELRRSQKGIDIMHTLFLFTDPSTCDSGVIRDDDLPDKWRTAKPFQAYDSRDKNQVMKSILLPCDDGKIINDCEILTAEDRRVLKKAVVDELSSAGRIILSRSKRLGLPESIQQCQTYALIWLYFIHHTLKPPRVVWKRVTRLDSMALGFGAINWESLQEVSLDVEHEDKFNMNGEFTFEPFNLNSFSQFRDLATASIDAIKLIKSRIDYNRNLNERKKEWRNSISGKRRTVIESGLSLIDNQEKEATPVEQIDRGTEYTAAQAYKKLKISKATFSTQRKQSGVDKIKKGERYSLQDLIVIARTICKSNSTTDGTKEGSIELLREFGEQIPE
tara:strand:+ start:46258 stop:47301 length:1044 start_codon:yes stop_codon:yes gene_type:complete